VISGVFTNSMLGGNSLTSVAFELTTVSSPRATKDLDLNMVIKQGGTDYVITSPFVMTVPAPTTVKIITTSPSKVEMIDNLDDISVIDYKLKFGDMATMPGKLEITWDDVLFDGESISFTFSKEFILSPTDKWLCEPVTSTVLTTVCSVTGQVMKVEFTFSGGESAA
jgi:hypothetical protein